MSQICPGIRRRSLAFFFIIVPFVGAYAWHEHLTPMFAAWTFLFSVPFVILFSAVGTLATIVIVRWAPGGRWLKFIVPAMFMAIIGLIIHLSQTARDQQLHDLVGVLDAQVMVVEHVLDLGGELRSRRVAAITLLLQRL